MTRARSIRIPPFAAALALAAGGAALVAVFGLRTHGLAIFDEKFTVQGARWLQEDLGRITETPGFADRGVERLATVLLLPVVAWVHSTATQFEVAHVLWAVIYALSAVPAFLLARGLGAGTRWALVAAALVVFGPWAVFGTVFLNNAPAATASAFALWAMWRSVTTPALRWDALALMLLATAALTRVSSAALALAFPVAIAGQAVRDYRNRRDESLATFARILLWRHWLLAAMGVAALGVVVVSPERLVGSYPTSVRGGIDTISDHLFTSIAQLSIGTALIGAAIGGGWVLRQVIRPTSPAAGTFAVLAAATFLVVTWINLAGVSDERYELPLVVPLAVAFATAMGRNEAAPAPTAVVALICWWSVHRHARVPLVLSSDYLSWPSREFFSQLWLGRLSSTLSLSGKAATELLAGAGFAASVVVASVRGPWRPRTDAIAGALVVVVGLAGAGWTMNKLTDSLYPGQSFAAVTFVDDVTDGERADPLASTAEMDPAVPQLWSEIQFFNRSLHHPLSLEGPAYALCCRGLGNSQVVSVDHGTGALSSDSSLPRFILTVPEWQPAGLVASIVFVSAARSPTPRVERLVSPPRAAWLSEGIDGYGWVRPGLRAVLRVFPRPAEPCLRATVRAPAGAAPFHWRLGPRAGTLPRGGDERVEIRLRSRAAIDLPVSGSPSGPDGVTGRTGRIGLSDLRLGPCGAPPDPAPRLEP